MPSVGRSTTSGNNFSRSNTGSNNQVGYAIVMPETGQIKTLHVYVAGNGGAITGQLCLWDASGNLLRTTGNITFSAAAGTGVNQQSFQSADLTSPYNATAGQTLYIGFWRSSAQTANYSYISSGGTIHPDPQGSTANVGSPGNLSFGSSAVGQLSAYADYVTGGIKVTTDAVNWKKHPVKVSDGAVWKWRPLRTSNGSVWTRRA